MLAYPKLLISISNALSIKSNLTVIKILQNEGVRVRS
jgi:hypothetical protein